MKTKNVRMSGAHVLTHLAPTFGSTTVSRMNSADFERVHHAGRHEVWRT